MISSQRPPLVTLGSILIVAFAIIAILVQLCSTTVGIGISPDSVTYIASARSLLDGEGLSKPDRIDGTTPMTHFPPLFPILLAAIGITGFDIAFIARFFNAFLFGANLLLLGYLSWKISRASLTLTIFVCFFFLASEEIIAIHSMAWSEPIYLFLSLLGLHLLSRFLTSDKPLHLILAASVIGLTFTARYVGFAVVLATFSGILLLGKQPIFQRLKYGAVLVLISCTPISAWLIRNKLVANSPIDAVVAYYPISSEQLLSGLETISKWFLPGRIPQPASDIITISILLGCAGFLLKQWIMDEISKRKGIPLVDPSSVFPYLLFLYILAYIATLILSNAFFYPIVGFGSRILAPIFPICLLIITALFRPVFKRNTWYTYAILLLLALPLVALYVVHGTRWVTKAHAGAYKGYAYLGPSGVRLIEMIEEVPDEVPIYSNEENIIIFFANRHAAMIPEKWNPFSILPNPNFETEIADMRQILKERDGIILYFLWINSRPYLPTNEELNAMLALSPISRSEGWIVYKYSEEQ